jgi:hexosaminidase
MRIAHLSDFGRVRFGKALFVILLCCGFTLFPPIANESMALAIDLPEGYAIMGDANASGKIDIDDVTYLISYVFIEGPPPAPLRAGDPDGSGGIDIDDITYLITYIFVSGPPPVSLGPIIPKPVISACSDEEFTLNAGDTIWVHAEPSEAAIIGQYLADKLNPSTAYGIEVHATSRTPSSGIFLTTSSAKSALGDEGYELTITSDIVTLEAYGEEGLFRGIQTIRQLFPSGIEGPTVSEGPWTMPGGYILDYPSFEWRGFLIDVVRHFFTAETVKEYIDMLAYYKMNVFHWHLTDDQGWRPEVASHPLLNEIGSWRGDDNYGGYYTTAEMQEVVEYAAARYIDVIPEIEMPGHSTAAVVSYPWIMCHPPEDSLEVPEAEGIYNTILCPGQDSTLDFLKTILDEIVDIFPSGIIHIGGDEVLRTRWEVCPHCQQRIADLGLADEYQLQNWFMKEVSWYLYDTHNRNTSGWSEGGVCQDGMPPGTQSQWWAPGADIASLAEQGYDVVNTHYGTLYLDKWYCVLSEMYDYDITGGADSTYVDHILGAETAVWTEFVVTESELADKVFPRIAALAENVWTPASEKNYPEFYTRLLKNLECLDHMGIEYGDMEE